MISVNVNEIFLQIYILMYNWFGKNILVNVSLNFFLS